MQFSLDITKLLQLLFPYLALFWVDNRMSFLPTCVSQFALRDWHSQKVTFRVMAKLQRESLYHFRFASSIFISCLHIQVFCCLGKCLVGFWRGYFNQKRCRRRCIIQISMEEYQFCTTLFSILIKTVRKLILSFLFLNFLRNPVWSWITFSEQRACDRVYVAIEWVLCKIDFSVFTGIFGQSTRGEEIFGNKDQNFLIEVQQTVVFLVTYITTLTSLSSYAKSVKIVTCKLV